MPDFVLVEYFFNYKELYGGGKISYTVSIVCGKKN